MPTTNVIFYREDDDSVPILDWLDAIPAKAQVKCLARLKRLEDLGHELRRPEADLLRDGIYELRVGLQGIHYRMLYFFHGKDVAVVSHGLTKERKVPPREIDAAISRMEKFEADPERHTFQPE
ncbi:type II toxin-antitoxin system RelE/ParE family toxin [Tautonia sociabilis]|uniref:Type II toxin-antitoxin system RelE/ParE family toxin n=1 Tax=Tautonia sociabilis TaxID=2080755 RepID=A0A432MF35_9BACT|nr:type II toxin-antitoxin system RelE/ParE family toxin [Tautonia sociabilis]RUL84375.1 type II toxin-antitoxin system RelE/ParE family toxin [Tautonia sociabilis]